ACRAFNSHSQSDWSKSHPKFAASCRVGKREENRDSKGILAVVRSDTLVARSTRSASISRDPSAAGNPCSPLNYSAANRDLYGSGDCITNAFENERSPSKSPAGWRGNIRRPRTADCYAESMNGVLAQPH